MFEIKPFIGYSILDKTSKFITGLYAVFTLVLTIFLRQYKEDNWVFFVSIGVALFAGFCYGDFVINYKSKALEYIPDLSSDRAKQKWKRYLRFYFFRNLITFLSIAVMFKTIPILLDGLVTFNSEYAFGDMNVYGYFGDYFLYLIYEHPIYLYILLGTLAFYLISSVTTLSSISKLARDLPEIREYRKEKTIHTALFALLLYGGADIISKLILIFWIVDITKWMVKKTPGKKKTLKAFIKKLKGKSDIKNNFFLSYARARKGLIWVVLLPAILIPSVLILKLTDSLTLLTSAIIVIFLFLIYLKLDYSRKEQQKIKSERNKWFNFVITTFVVLWALFAIIYTNYVLYLNILPPVLFMSLTKVDYIIMWEQRAQFFVNILPAAVTQQIVLDWRFSSVFWAFLNGLTYFANYLVINIIIKLAEKSAKNDMKYMTLLPDILAIASAALSVVFFSTFIANRLTLWIITLVLVIIVYITMLKFTIKSLERDEEARGIKLSELMDELSKKILFRFSLGFNIIKIYTSINKTVTLTDSIEKEDEKSEETTVLSQEPTVQEMIPSQEPSKLEIVPSQGHLTQKIAHFVPSTQTDTSTAADISLEMKEEKPKSKINSLLLLLFMISLSSYMILKFIDFYIFKGAILSDLKINLIVNISTIVIASLVYANMFSSEDDVYKNGPSQDEKRVFKIFNLVSHFFFMAALLGIYYYLSFPAGERKLSAHLFIVLIIFVAGSLPALIAKGAQEITEKEIKKKYGYKERFFKIDNPLAFVFLLAGIDVFCSFILIFLAYNTVSYIFQKRERKEGFLNYFEEMKTLPFNLIYKRKYESILFIVILLPITLMAPLFLFNIMGFNLLLQGLISIYLFSVVLLVYYRRKEYFKQKKTYNFVYAGSFSLCLITLGLVLYLSLNLIMKTALYITFVFNTEFVPETLVLNQVALILGIFCLSLTILVLLLLLVFTFMKIAEFRQGDKESHYSRTDVLKEYIVLIISPVILGVVIVFLADYQALIVCLLVNIGISLILILLNYVTKEENFKQMVVGFLSMIVVSVAFSILFLGDNYWIGILLNIANIFVCYMVYEGSVRSEISNINTLFKKNKIKTADIIDYLEQIDKIEEIVTKSNPIWKFSMYVKGLKSLALRKKDLKKKLIDYKMLLQNRFEEHV